MKWIDSLMTCYLIRSKAQAKIAAHELTCWVSENKGAKVDPSLVNKADHLKEFVEPLLGMSIGSSLLSIPWAAYDKVFFNLVPLIEEKPEVRWLLTFPGGSLTHETEPQIDVGLYIDRFADLLRGAKNTVIISNPYWSESAVIRLINRLQDWRPPSDLELSIITREELEDSNMLAIQQFMAFLTRKEITAKLLKLDRMTIGIAHAKFIIADIKKILLGSANLTHSGTSENFELCVYIESTELIRPLCEMLKEQFSVVRP